MKAAQPGVRRQDLAIAAGLVLATWLAGAPALDNGFVAFDDPLYVTQNPVTQQGLTLAGALWAFTTGFAANWHPLTWLSVMLDVELFGLVARGHHATSLALHALDAVLVYALMRRMGLGLGTGALAAGLWGLHPLRVESVAWVAERKDVLSMAFALLALLAYLRHGEAPRASRMGWVALWLALGLMAKPMLVTLPFVMLLLDWWPLGRVGSPRGLASPGPGTGAPADPRRRLLDLVLEKAPLFVLVALSSWITYRAQAAGGSMVLRIPLAYRILDAIDAYGAYVAKTLWPKGLAVIYPIPVVIDGGRLLATLLALAAISIVAWRARAGRPWLLVGWLWFVGTLVPVIGLVQVGNQAYADRYTYLPSIGLVLILAPLAAEAAVRLRLPRAVAAAAAIAVLAALVAASRDQTRLWQSTSTLFEHTLAVTGRNPVARLILSSDRVTAGDLAGAEAMLVAARADGAPEAAVRLNLGVVHQRQGRRTEALREFDAVLAIVPDQPKALLNRGIVLAELQRNGEAIASLDRVVALGAGGDAGDLIAAHRALAAALAASGRSAEAEAHRRAADAVGSPR